MSRSGEVEFYGMKPTLLDVLSEVSRAMERAAVTYDRAARMYKRTSDDREMAIKQRQKISGIGVGRTAHRNVEELWLADRGLLSEERKVQKR
jgi:hypothetical protein